jgi:hypothetical protein
VKNTHEKDRCCDEIGLCVQDVDIILGSILLGGKKRKKKFSLVHSSLIPKYDMLQSPRYKKIKKSKNQKIKKLDEIIFLHSSTLIPGPVKISVSIQVNVGEWDLL